MKKIPYFDAHCDSISYCCYSGQSLSDSRGHIALNRTDAFSAYVQIFACFGDIFAMEKERGCKEFLQMCEYFAREMEQHSGLAAHCKGRQDVLRAIEAGKTAALLSLEESGLLGFDPEQLEMAADWGVQCINLTWNHRNPLSGSCAEAPEQGLTDRGRAFVQEMQRLHILVDVSHLSARGFWDVFELAEQPVIATHSNADVIWPHRRNLTDDQFRAIMESGGVAGLNFYQQFIGGKGDIPALIRHLEHFLELGGEDHVGLGADLDGCSEVCTGIGELTGVPSLWAALEARGYGEALLRKLFFENWLRVIRP